MFEYNYFPQIPNVTLLIYCYWPVVFITTVFFFCYIFIVLSSLQIFIIWKKVICVIELVFLFIDVSSMIAKFLMLTYSLYCFTLLWVHVSNSFNEWETMFLLHIYHKIMWIWLLQWNWKWKIYPIPSYRIKDSGNPFGRSVFSLDPSVCLFLLFIKGLNIFLVSIN